MLLMKLRAEKPPIRGLPKAVEQKHRKHLEFLLGLV